MGCFLHADYVVFLALILIDVLLVVAIPKLDPAAVRKRKFAVRLVVVHKPGQFRLQRSSMVFVQLRQRTPEQQELEVGIPEREQDELSPHCPAFAAAARAAVSGVPGAGAKELHLTRIWIPL
jgi:hypothetical protein